MDAETGSVAINTIPKAKPPKTKCHQNGIANIGLVSEPMLLNSKLVAIIPTITPAIIRHEAIRVHNNKAAPIKIAKVDTSPILPCRLPKKASAQVMVLPQASTMASRPPVAAKPSGVAPLKPSTAVHRSEEHTSELQSR